MIGLRVSVRVRSKFNIWLFFGLWLELCFGLMVRNRVTDRVTLRARFKVRFVLFMFSVRVIARFMIS